MGKKDNWRWIVLDDYLVQGEKVLWNVHDIDNLKFW